MGGDAQIGQDAVHLRVAVVTDEVVHEPEIVVHQDKPFVSRGLRQGVGIFVEGNQPSLGTEPLQNGPAVATAPEGGVNVDPFGFEKERLDALLEKYGDVVSGHVVLPDLSENFLGKGDERSAF